MARTYNGWPALDVYPAATFVAPGGKHVYLANGAVSKVLEYVAVRWHHEIEPIAVSDPANRRKPRERHYLTPDGEHDLIGIHGWRPRNTTVGTGNMSNHRSATAIDINGHLHPYEATIDGDWYSGFTREQIATLRAILGAVRDNAGRRILRTGLDFARGRRDGMHVEIGPGVTYSQVSQAAANLTTTNEEEFDVSDAQFDQLKDAQDEILNILNHHIRGNPSKDQKADAGTSQNLPLKDLAWLTAGRVNTLRARQWDVIKATDAVVEALSRRGVALDDQTRADVAAALSGDSS